MTTTRTGNRRKVPNDALKICPSCGEPRGNRRQSWEPIDRGTEVLGYTGPVPPTWAEPIRRTGAGRFVAVVDATPPGATKRKQAKKTTDSLGEARQFVA